MLKFKLLLASLSFFTFSQAQIFSVQGILQDMTDKSGIRGASIKIRAQDTTIEKSVLTDSSGRFFFNSLTPRLYRLSISAVGYGDVSQSIKIDSGDVDMGIVPFSKETKILGEVNIKVTVPPVRQKADTVEYSASAFKVNPDANAEDMIKKMPGVTVDKGTVTAQGEQVKKVTIDGREFFGDDATAALRNMPAEVIDKIQVFDRLSDQAAFTGFDDGTGSKSINIVTKANMRNGNFGRVYAGYGTDERYAAGGNVSFFNGNRRISLVGLSNNINQQNFAQQDLLGATTTPSRGGRSGGGGRPQGGGNAGGGGGGNSGQGGNSGNFLVGQQSGISKTNSFGINYSDLWSKGLTVTGSYFYNNSNNTNDEISNREYFLSGDSSQFYNENSIATSKNFNHRINVRAEYKIDSANTIIFTPTISFQKNTSVNNTTAVNYFSGNNIISNSINNNLRNTSGYNMNSGLLYRHSFAKRGRTISLNFNAGSNNRDGEEYLTAYSQFFKTNLFDTLRQFTDNSTKGYTLSTNIAFTEPIGTKGQLQFNYNPSYTSNNANQETYQFNDLKNNYSTFDSGLSNKFDNTVKTQNGGVSFRHGDRDNMYSFGANYQNSQLESQQFLPYTTTVDKSFSNILPNAMARFKLSPKSNIRLNYRTSTNVPSISQLQGVIDISNPILLRTGNPDLQQQYTHTFFTRYQFTNTAKGQSLFANIFFQNTQDYIGNSILIDTTRDIPLNNSVTLNKGAQLSRPVNLDGYWSLRSFFTFGMPLKFIKSTINWNAGYTYSKIPGQVIQQSKLTNSKTASNNYNIGAVVASNVSEFVDFNVSYSANFNQSTNTLRPQDKNQYFTHVAGLALNLISKKGWVFQTDATNQFYSGLSDGFNQNFWLWNMSAGKKFLKNQAGELRLSVFDILKQNNSITRTINDNIEDVQNTVLQQYFMLTFSYKLKNFTKPKQR